MGVDVEGPAILYRCLTLCLPHYYSLTLCLSHYRSLTLCLLHYRGSLKLFVCHTTEVGEVCHTTEVRKYVTLPQSNSESVTLTVTSAA